ncbi:hypothetical protein SK128_004762, partial [Halocaridina rubra]
YLADISYIRGSHNIVADCLFRPANAVMLDVCDLPEIAEVQFLDKETQAFSDRLRSFQLLNEEE